MREAIVNESLSALTNCADNSENVCDHLDLHYKTDFDVDFELLSSQTVQMSWKTSYCFTGLTLWTNISAFEITYKPWSCPTSINEGATVVIMSGINYCIFKSCPLDTLRNPIW